MMTSILSFPNLLQNFSLIVSQLRYDSDPDSAWSSVITI